MFSPSVCITNIVFLVIDEFRLQVTYNTVQDGELTAVGEGRILLVQPRHPSNVLAGDNATGDLGDGWNAEAADNLTGLFCR